MGMCGIIFDLDGVLCYTDHYHYLAWKAVADRLSLPFDEQVNNRLRGVSRMESLEIILSLGSKTYSQEEKEQMAAEKNRLYRSYLERMGPEALAPGAVDVLRTLRENGWKTGIGSSSKTPPSFWHEPDWTDSLTRWQMAVRLPSRNLIRKCSGWRRGNYAFPLMSVLWWRTPPPESWPQMQAAFFPSAWGTPPRPPAAAPS